MARGMGGSAAASSLPAAGERCRGWVGESRAEWKCQGEGEGDCEDEKESGFGGGVGIVWLVYWYSCRRVCVCVRVRMCTGRSLCFRHAFGSRICPRFIFHSFLLSERYTKMEPGVWSLSFIGHIPCIPFLASSLIPIQLNANTMLLIPFHNN